MVLTLRNPKKVCIMQPGYLQPLHYYARIYESDVFVSLDAAQINRKTGQHRAQLAGGITCTVPVQGGNRVALVDAIPAYAEHWVDQHLKTVRQLYAFSAPNFVQVFSWLERMLRSAEQHQWSLARIGLQCAIYAMDYASWRGDIVTEQERPTGLAASAWMLDIAKRYGADVYVCGMPAYESYLDKVAFECAGVSLSVQDWACAKYRAGQDFKKNLSVLDGLMYCSQTQFRMLLAGSLL